MRSTKIRTTEKTLVTVPNKQMVDSILDNQSMRNQRRAEIKLMLSEKSDPAVLQKFIESVKTFLDRKEEEIIKSNVFLTNFSKDGAEVTIEYFTQPFTKAEYDKEKQKVNFKLMTLMSELKLEMSSSASSINIINEPGGAPKSDNIL